MWYAHRLFSVGGCDYDGLDVAVAATAWGDWGRVRDHARHAIACSSHAEATEDDADPGEVESAAADFRYARDLITAEDTGAWLGQWGLSVEAWMDAMERSVLRRRWAAELDELAGRYPVSDEELSAVLAAEGICSGDLARLAETLAARAVIHDGHPVAASVGRADESRGAPEPDPVAIPYPTAGLSAVSPERWRERAAHVAALEASFEQFRRAAVTPALAGWLRAEHNVDAVHLVELGMHRARDPAIFAAARAADRVVVIVTKDDDFPKLLGQHGPPPKVVWVRCGTVTNQKVRRIVLEAWPRAMALLAGEALVEIRRRHDPAG